MFTVKTDGFDALVAKFRSLPDKLKTEVTAELKDAANRWEALAKRDAPGDVGFLRNEITNYQTGELTFDVVSGASYAGYVEFGTKTKVQIPAGLEEFAAKLKGVRTATSLTAKDAIFKWCKRKGIEKRLWYPIYRSIMVKGISPRPYFFKQQDIVIPDLERNLKNILSNID